MKRFAKSHGGGGQESGREPAGDDLNDRRILILAPTGNDAHLTARFLREAGLSPHVCRDASEVHKEVSAGCGAILLAEETLGVHSSKLLVQALADQPAWSDIPVTVITSGGEADQMKLRRVALLGPGGNVTVLERPFRPATLVSTLEVALRTRRRQYEARDLVTAMGRLMRQQEEQTRLFDTTLSSITDLAYTFDVEGNWIYANQPLLKLWGKTLEEIKGKSCLELGYPPELAERLKAEVKEVVATKRPVRGGTYFTDITGVEDYHEYIFSPVFAVDGSVSAVCGTTRLTTDQKRAEAVAESQRRVLQFIAEDRPLEEVLDELMRTAELECEGKISASILLLEPDGMHLRYGAAPSLPMGYIAATDGQPIGPEAGSCGTAAYRKEPVYVTDIANDPLWAGLKHLALSYGLRACWSTPIFSTHGDVLGVFTVYDPQPHSPSPGELHMAEMITRTAGIAIERKRSDAALRESQKRYSQLVHALPTAVYTTDAEGRVLLFNEAAALLWGRRPKIGQDMWCGSYRIYRPDGTMMPLDECPMAITLREGRPVRGQEILIERPNGERRNVVPYPDPIRDESGAIVGAVNMLLDVTESRKAEEASRRLAAIVESSEDAIISKDLNGAIMSWNRGAERLFGYTAEEIIGKPGTLLMPPDHYNEEPSIMERIRRGERIEHYETIRRRKDGSTLEISLTLSPIRREDGKIVGASKIVRDITERKQAERRLQQAHAEAVAASRAKDEFLAALSHELRTPLNPVLLLASDAAEDPELSPEIRGKFATIRNNVELEARLIDDLLDITRIAHGKLSLNVSMLNVEEVLREAIGTVRAEIAQKKILLIEDLRAKDPLVKGDAVRLQQVFWNILKNAVKFTPERGRIIVSTRRRGTNDVVVSIADTGLGLSPAELTEVFEAFAQGEHVSSGGAHRFGGLGLGLAISRKLVESHNGTITASSGGRNQGAIFETTLPLSWENVSGAAAGSPRGNGGSESAANVERAATHILLVEDHEPTRTALAHLLSSRHYEVKTAASLAEARELASRENFELVISDIGLPDGDGFELMSELRASNQNIQGIALTGYGMENDVARSRAAGFGMHLTKPVQVRSLEKAVIDLIKTRQ